MRIIVLVRGGQTYRVSPYHDGVRTESWLTWSDRNWHKAVDAVHRARLGYGPPGALTSIGPATGR